MDDLIRRSDAIKAVSEPYNEKFWDYVNQPISDVVNILKSIPAVEPKHGEWSFIGDNMFECSHCGITYSTKQFDAIRNYTTDPFAPEHCPKCGAKMKGADDE